MRFLRVVARRGQTLFLVAQIRKRLRSFCNSLLAVCCCGLIAAGGANPALAAPYERGTGFAPPVQDQRPRPGRQREAEKPAPQREPPGPGDADRGRMSPEERRQLRRDIRDAGKDLYQRERQTPRRSGRR